MIPPNWWAFLILTAFLSMDVTCPFNWVKEASPDHNSSKISKASSIPLLINWKVVESVSNW